MLRPVLLLSLAAVAGHELSAQTGDWRPLFDGHTTEGWRGFRMDSMPSGWRVVDGALTRVGPGGDIITTDEFTNFELRLEWKVAEGGSSGVLFRVSEAAEATEASGPEMQVLDDARHPDGTSRLTAAGSNVGLYPAPAGIVKPAGQWNAIRIVVNGQHVVFRLNSRTTAEFDLGSPEWESRVSQSDFARWPRYGRESRGHIALQDHGDRVSYRDIRIKVLP